jgi:hypothetical protein
MKNSNETKKPAPKGKLPSYASGSTGTTILGWTPPHEKTYARPPMAERRRSSSLTDHTTIGFTPPHEIIYASQSRPAREAPAPPRTSTKKSLPWLRTPGTSSEASPTKKRSAVSVKPEQHRVSTFDASGPAEPKTKKNESAEKRE